MYKVRSKALADHFDEIDLAGHPGMTILFVVVSPLAARE